MKYTKRHSHNGYSFLIKYYAFSIAMCLFFSQYNFIVSGISIADFMLLSSSIIFFINKQKVKATNTGLLWIFYFLSIISTLFVMILLNFNTPLVSLGKLITRWVRYGIYTILIIIYSDNCYFRFDEENKILKVYKFFCYLIGCYAIAQAVVFFLFHYMLPVNVLPISWSRDTDSASISDFVQNNYFRGFGPFQEPSYLSKFLLPGLVFSLFGWSFGKIDKTDIKLSSIITIAIILSTSVQGILIVAVTYCVYLIAFHQALFKKVLLIILIILSICLFITYSSVASDRIGAIFSGQKYGYSSDMRLYRGFAFWFRMPFLYKIFGVGLGNMANFAYIYNISTPYDPPMNTLLFSNASVLEYGSGLSLILVQSGILGFSLFVLWCFKCIKRTNLTGRTIFLQFLLVLFSGSGLFSINTIFYCTLIFLNGKDIIESDKKSFIKDI